MEYFLQRVRVKMVCYDCETKRTFVPISTRRQGDTLYAVVYRRRDTAARHRQVATLQLYDCRLSSAAFQQRRSIVRNSHHARSSICGDDYVGILDSVCGFYNGNGDVCRHICHLPHTRLARCRTAGIIYRNLCFSGDFGRRKICNRRTI